MKQEKSRKQSMGVGLLLQKVLALYHMEDSKISVSEQGKPMVDGLEFSLSHSGALVICAVSDVPVGCDVEMICKAPKGVASRYFSDREQAYLRKFSEEEYDRAFFQIWTMKESYVKMTGEGMGVPFEAYEVMVEDGAPSEHDACGYVFRNGTKQACNLSTMELQGYIISICAKTSAHVEVIWENL